MIISTEVLLGRDNMKSMGTPRWLIYATHIAYFPFGDYHDQHWDGQKVGPVLEKLTNQSNLLIYTWEYQ